MTKIKRTNALEAAADEALGVEDGVARVHRGLVFCGIANQTLLGSKGDVGRRRAVALCILRVRSLRDNLLEA